MVRGQLPDFIAGLFRSLQFFAHWMVLGGLLLATAVSCWQRRRSRILSPRLFSGSLSISIGFSLLWIAVLVQGGWFHRDQLGVWPPWTVALFSLALATIVALGGAFSRWSEWFRWLFPGLLLLHLSAVASVICFLSALVLFYQAH